MKNRALIALVTIVIAVFGGIALTSLKQELVPSIEFPQLAVLTNYVGASPEVVNEDVSTPIETAIQGVDGIESTSATSSTNLSIVNATFTYGTNLANAEQKLNQAINRIKSTLPEDLDPQVLSGSIGDFPVIQIAVTDKGSDTAALSALLKKSALSDIQDVPGVRAAQLVGDAGQRVTITPDDAKLAAAGLSTQAIKDAVSSNGLLVPAGSLTEDGKTLSVQAGSKLSSVADIQGLPLKGLRPDGSVLTIADVATVELTQNPVTSISRVNGEPALTIAVTKLPAANTVEVSNAVRDLLPSIEKGLDGATFTIVFDQAPYIQQSIESLTTEGLLGLLFAVIVILVFLMSVRSTLVTAISIPTSVLITFIGLQSANYSLNIITLGALTIAIGRVVDDSIVVIENIKRHLTANGAHDGTPTDAGKVRAAVIIDAVREVAGAITASTLTTVAVFLPIAFVGDTTGELFRPFALTVTIALLASLLVALTIVPVLAYWFLRVKPAKHHAHASEPSAHLADAGTNAADPAEGTSRRARRQPSPVEEEQLTALQKRYLPIIGWTLRRPVITIVASALLLLITLGLTPFMKTNFLGASGQNTLTVTQTVPVGSSLEAQDAAAKDVETALRGIDGIQTVQLSIGSSGSALRDAFVGGGSNAINYSITTDPSVDQDALQAEVRSKLGKIVDPADLTVAASSGFGASSDIEVDVTATTQKDLQAASDAILKAVSKLDAIQQSESNLSSTRPYLAVSVDRSKAAAAGLSEVAVGGLVSQAMQPQTVGQIIIDETSYSIYIQAATSPMSRDELAALTIPTIAGPVRLDSLATVEVQDGPATVTTVKGLRTATISATPSSDNLGTASAEVQKAVDDTKLPDGASASLGGVTSDQGSAFSQLFIALLVAILIVYVIMVATFRSLLQPLILLVSIPFAATGAIGLQVITGIPLGVPSIIGLLMLIGIVVTNAIVLVDLVNQYRAKGLSVYDALIEGASRRLRPILMTALATIFALLPMAVGLTGNGGGFISQPLALVVIGGLVSSTVLTLIVVPVLYYLVEGLIERIRARRDEAASSAPRRASWPAPEADSAG